MPTFDPVAALNLAIYLLITVITTFAAAAKVYYGIRSEMRSNHEALKAHIESNDEDHARLTEDIRDHEIRIRVLEKVK